MTFVRPTEALTAPVPLPRPFPWFVGPAEGLDALGLVLARLRRVRRGLTRVAADGRRGHGRGAASRGQPRCSPSALPGSAARADPGAWCDAGVALPGRLAGSLLAAASDDDVPALDSAARAGYSITKLF